LRASTERLSRGAERRQEARRIGALGVAQGQQQMLGGDVRVAELLRFLLGGVEHLREFA
jgi:hypothetical protein